MDVEPVGDVGRTGVKQTHQRPSTLLDSTINRTRTRTKTRGGPSADNSQDEVTDVWCTQR